MLIPHRFHHLHREHRREYVEHPRARPLGHGLDLVAQRKDGQEFPVEVGLSYAPAAEGILVMSYITDITERRQAEEIRLEQERLRASLRKEQEFNSLVQRTISALSHDIRTPLTVIATAKDMLEQYFDRLSEQKRREKLDSIGRQLHYVLELLNDMTLVVKGSLDHASFRLEPVNLVSLCRISMEEIRESTGTRHDLRFVADGQVDTARVDATLVSRILLNLLSNAVKFTPEPGEVRLELSRHDEWIVVRVVDQGIGIAPAELGHIFEPFYRAANARSTGGTGLGLNIVSECVARHRGQIRVESEMGRGSSFTVELPYFAV
jgi:signal transduction histidine kinase